MDEYDEDVLDLDYGTCESEGMNGNCGEECNVFLRGDCHIADEIEEHINEREEDEALKKKPEDDFNRSMEMFNAL